MSARCPRCNELGIHESEDQCLARLRRAVEGERMKIVTAQESPGDEDLLRFTSLLVEYFTPPTRRKGIPWRFRTGNEGLRILLGKVPR
jgi:hypothetical protein